MKPKQKEITMSQNEEYKREPAEFDRLMANLGRIKQFPIDPQPINPTPPPRKSEIDRKRRQLAIERRLWLRNFNGTIQTTDGVGQKIDAVLEGEEEELDFVPRTLAQAAEESLHTAARGLVRDGIAKDFEEGLEMAKEWI
jgi:hypothetical protein